ncbi:uncharacterized protein LOC133806743 [Humulus lupulus]|uniref:uncharacterized protein LOC133806738 n=1 Tax=Humulus lupulus TaxID=3486 RepID=UPI002B402CA6|nr:uncharacterized protein LOC133806738 [Humulus lupulus]XP_062100816.1 uncharacterized protein LOC133806743 [Humulus lupulus]
MEEEEYMQNEGEAEEMFANANPATWWHSVTDGCSQADPNDDEGAYVSEEDLQSLSSSDEDGNARRRKRSNNQFNHATNMDNFIFKLGMFFAIVDQFRTALKEHFIKINREYVWLANDQRRVRAKCKSEGCNWVIYARVQLSDKRSFRVNTLVDRHTCGLVFNNKHATSNWLAKHYLEQFRINPNLTYTGFMQLTTRTQFSRTTRSTFYRAKNCAKVMLKGTIREQYAILEDYCKQLLETNPGSTSILKTRMQDGKRLFERVYICLKACKDGFLNGCRPLICLDGCFLKGYCKGMLLAAIGIDAANAMFPVAYAVVEKEYTGSWTWFLNLLKEDLKIDEPERITMISDRQKGLENAFSTVFQGSEVRFCVRHMHANFKKQFPRLLLKQMMWAAARATTKVEWKNRMNEIKQENFKAYEWLMKKDPEEWTKSHFREHVKCDILINNHCESFNNAILDARDKSIITLLENIRHWMMSLFCNRRMSVSKWVHPVSKRIMDIIEKSKNIAKHCFPMLPGGGKFQVNLLQSINA